MPGNSLGQVRSLLSDAVLPSEFPERQEILREAAMIFGRAWERIVLAQLMHALPTWSGFEGAVIHRVLDLRGLRDLKPLVAQYRLANPDAIVLMSLPDSGEVAVAIDCKLGFHPSKTTGRQVGRASVGRFLQHPAIPALLDRSFGEGTCQRVLGVLIDGVIICPNSHTLAKAAEELGLAKQLRFLDSPVNEFLAEVHLPRSFWEARSPRVCEETPLAHCIQWAFGVTVSGIAFRHGFGALTDPVVTGKAPPAWDQIAEAIREKQQRDRARLTLTQFPVVLDGAFGLASETTKQQLGKLLARYSALLSGRTTSSLVEVAVRRAKGAPGLMREVEELLRSGG